MRIAKNSNILILSHFYKRAIAGGGPPQEVRDYLLPKVKSIVYIEHPFPYGNDHRSSMTVYENGVLKKQIFTPSLKGPPILFYILDIFLTFYFVIRAKTKFDLCIALDNLNTVSILPFKKVGLVKKLVFYTIDYTPNRFKNKILNNIYHLIDRIACYNADAIWVLSPRMMSARKQNGAESKKTAPSIVLPMGANLSRIKKLPFEKINRHQIAYVGILLEKQGVQLILETLPKIIKKIPDVKLVIIGKGEHEHRLRFLAQQLGITDYVEFKGFIENHKEVENILCRSAIGVAPYVTGSDNYTSYTDPAKPKLYLGCGLPVVLTGVPEIAHIIKEKHAGFVVEYTIESLTRALIQLLEDDNLYKECRKNAIELSKEYNTNSLIANALDKTN